MLVLLSGQVKITVPTHRGHDAILGLGGPGELLHPADGAADLDPLPPAPAGAFALIVVATYAAFRVRTSPGRVPVRG